jgi:hypothetical protein
MSSAVSVNMPQVNYSKFSIYVSWYNVDAQELYVACIFFFFFSEMYDYASDIPIPSLEVCLLAC